MIDSRLIPLYLALVGAVLIMLSNVRAPHFVERASVPGGICEGETCTECVELDEFSFSCRTCTSDEHRWCTGPEQPLGVWLERPGGTSVRRYAGEPVIGEDECGYTMRSGERSLVWRQTPTADPDEVRCDFEGIALGDLLWLETGR